MSDLLEFNYQLRAFDGLEKSYRNMYDKIIPPRCHLTPMEMESGDDGDRSVEWWECKHCGHTKEF
jgi:hypothetical protein